MRPVLSSAIAAGFGLIVACSDSSSPAAPTSDFVIDGSWYWEETVADNSLGIQCFDSGTVTVTQSRARFTAAGHIAGACTGPGGTADIYDPIQVRSGTLSGATATFSVDGCPYRGTAHGSPPTPDSLSGTVSCTVTSNGVTAQLGGTWRMLLSHPDYEVPMVTGSLSGSSVPPTYPNAIMLRDSLRITVQATDNGSLIWIGYTLSGSAASADSIPVTGRSANRTLSQLIVPSMVGSLDVTVFARDSAGNRTTHAVGSLTVLNVAAALTDSATLPGAVVDLAYDARRDRIYLTTYKSTQVLVLDRATGAAAAPIPLPGNGGGLDLSVGGDSLLVALADRSSIAAVNLVTSAVDTLHIGFDQSLPRVALWLRVAANGQALVVGSVPGWSGIGAQVATVNLAAGVATVRTDLGFSGLIGLTTQLARIGDRSRVALIDVGEYPSTSLLYDSDGNGFSGPYGAGSLGAHEMQGSATGSRFLYARTVLDRNLAIVDSFPVVGGPGGATALSADGSSVFLGDIVSQFPGFELQSIAGHAVLERVYVPGWDPSLIADRRFAALADGKTLLVYQGSWGTLGGATKLLVVHLE